MAIIFNFSISRSLFLLPAATDEIKIYPVGRRGGGEEREAVRGGNKKNLRGVHFFHFQGDREHLATGV